MQGGHSIDSIKMTIKRIISFDYGKYNTGVCVVDAEGDEIREIHMMECLTVESHLTEAQRHNAYMTMIIERIDKCFVRDMDPSCVLVTYENTAFMYKNHDHIRLQVRVRRYFQNRYKKQVKIKALLPSQKRKVGGNVKCKRKDMAVQVMTEYLQSKFPEWMERVSEYERKHDIADALLGILYLVQHSPA